jgi:phenylalanyl-tRNA synthetase beta chain
MLGSRSAGLWNVDREKTAVDFYACKGVVEALVSDLGLTELRFARSTHPAFHPGRAADVIVGGAPVGAVGELHPEVAGLLELPRGAFLFELDAHRWLPQVDRAPQYRPPSRYPAVARDLAVVVGREVEAEAVRTAIAESDPARVREVRLFDVYSGRPLPEDRLSLAFSLQIGGVDRTLTDAEADAVLARAREVLAQRFGAEFRG